MTPGRIPRRAYHRAMMQVSNGVQIETLAGALESAGLRCLRIANPDAAVRGVVVHAPDDPAPRADLLLLCTTPAAGVPDCAAVVVREASAVDCLAAVPVRTAVFAAPDDLRWSDIYDRVQWAVGESFGRLAEHDVFHLADALAMAVGGAVSIEDVHRNVIAFSTVPGQPIDDVRRKGILGRHVPEHAERDQWYTQLWRAEDVVEFHAGPESTSRLATAVRVGTEPLGSIWVVGDRDSLSADAEQILLGAVDTVAACLAHQDHFASRGRDHRRRTLQELFSPDASREQLPLGPTRLVSIQRQPGAEQAELVDERIADVLSLHAHRLRGTALAAVLDDRVYALVPAVDRNRLEQLLGPVLARAGVSSALAVLSPVLDTAAHLPRVRHQVDLALRLHAADELAPGIAVVDLVDEAERLLLAEIAHAVADIEALRVGTIHHVAEHDRTHGTEYVLTLRAWLESGGDVPTAAAQVYVHPNTFRYRMTRLRALFDLDLDRPDQRLLLHLQLRLRDFT
jgi:hypothetical protein